MGLNKNMENSVYIFDYEKARPHLVCRLVPAQNQALLRKVPFLRAVEELMAVPCLCRYGEDGRIAAVPVSLFQAAQWGIEPEQLLQDAVSNMQKILPPVIQPMSDLMESPMNGSLRSVLLPALKKKFTQNSESDLDQLAKVIARRMGKQMQENSALEPMWVLGNDTWLLGAASILFPGVLDEFGEKIGRNFFILPSSIHEVILLPEGRAETRELLYEMVRSSNQKLSPARFLSNCVYYYDRINMKIQTL